MFATVQTYISKLAAELLPIKEIRSRARAAGIENASLEVSTYRAKGRLRITCKLPIAKFIADELRAAIGTATDERSRDAPRHALDAINAAIADSDRPPPPAFRGGMGG